MKSKYGLAGYLTKVPVRLFRLLSAEGTFSKDYVVDDDSDRLLQYYDLEDDCLRKQVALRLFDARKCRLDSWFMYNYEETGPHPPP